MFQFHVSEKLPEKVSQTMTYGGGATAVTSWGLSWPDIAAIVGATVAVIGLCVQIWATVRRDRRETEMYWQRIDEAEDSDDL